MAALEGSVQLFTQLAATFTLNNPILLAGQFGVESDDLLTSPKFKIGNGITAWNSLPYASQGAAPVTSVFGRTGAVVAASGDYTTTLVTEGTNLYYTQARFDSAFSGKSTSNLSEGTNLYFTDERVDDRVAALIQNGTGLTWTYVDASGTLTGNVSLSPFSTTNLSEGTNLYYTQSRFDSAFSAKSTTNLSEGTNLYYTDARVRGTAITGFVGGVNSAILATDTIIQAFDKTQGQIASLVTGVSSVSGTLNRITSTGGATPVIDIAATYVGQTSITTLGTITTGTWNGGIIDSVYGGTGVNNAGTITNASNTTITGGGTLALAGFTLTVPKTGTAVVGGGTLNFLSKFTPDGSTVGNSLFQDDGTYTGIGSGPVAGVRTTILGTSAGATTYGLQVHNTSGNNNGLIVRDDGNVGMGTASPLAKLHVTQSTAAQITAIFALAHAETSRSSSVGQFSMLNTNTTNNNWGRFEFADVANGTASAIIFCKFINHTTKAGQFEFATNSGGSLNTGMIIDSAGFVGVNVQPANPLAVNALTTADSLAQVAISTGGTANKGLVIQGVASQTENYFEIQSSTGSIPFSFSPNTTMGIGNPANATTVLRMLKTFTTASGTTRNGIDIDITHSASSSTAGLVGINGLIKNASTGSVAVGMAATTFVVSAQSTRNFAANGFLGHQIQMQTTSAQSGTIADAVSILFLSPSYSTVKPTTNIGCLIQNLGLSGITTSTGIRIEAQSGSTTNHGILSSATILINTPTTPMGYTTGAGGTVTQATSKSTGVTLNKVTGQITMNNATLNADTTVSFTLTNSAILAGDYVNIQHITGGTVGSYTASANSAAGSATVTVRNITAGNLGEGIVLKFIIFRSVTA